MTLPAPHTQDLPATINVPEGGFETSLLNTLIRSVKPKHRRDLTKLVFKMSVNTEQAYRDALVRRGVPDGVRLDNLSYGHSAVVVDETLDDGVILYERKPCCERDHDGDGNCDRHPAPRGQERVRRVDGELSVTAKPVRIPPRATANEVKGMAEHSKVQNASRGLVQFGAERNIMARHTEVVLDGARVGTVTGFATRIDLSPTARKVRPGDSGKLTVPGDGSMSMDKVNSAWSLWIAEGGTLSGLTMRVTISDPGMPNPETTEYRGVRFVEFSEGSANLGDLVSQAVNFTFLDSEVIQPIVEPANDKMYELWEYRWSDGVCRQKPDSLIPA